MIFTGGSCADVYLDDCLITCGNNIDVDSPTPAGCQLTCVLDEFCTSWIYEQTSQVIY